MVSRFVSDSWVSCIIIPSTGLEFTRLESWSQDAIFKVSVLNMSRSGVDGGKVLVLALVMKLGVLVLVLKFQRVLFVTNRKIWIRRGQNKHFQSYTQIVAGLFCWMQYQVNCISLAVHFSSSIGLGLCLETLGLDSWIHAWIIRCRFGEKLQF